MSIHLTHQELSDVSIQQYDPARIGQQAELRCVFSGSDLDLQYITWSKILNDGTSSFVYEYDACDETSKAFNELAGRATMQIVKPVEELGNRIFDISAQKRIPRSVGSEKEDVEKTLTGRGAADVVPKVTTRGPRKKRELHDLMKTLTRMMKEENGHVTADEKVSKGQSISLHICHFFIQIILYCCV